MALLPSRFLLALRNAITTLAKQGTSAVVIHLQTMTSSPQCNLRSAITMDLTTTKGSTLAVTILTRIPTTDRSETSAHIAIHSQTQHPRVKSIIRAIAFPVEKRRGIPSSFSTTTTHSIMRAIGHCGLPKSVNTVTLEGRSLMTGTMRKTQFTRCKTTDFFLMFLSVHIP